MLQYIQTLSPRVLFYLVVAVLIAILLAVRFFRLRRSAAKNTAAAPRPEPAPKAQPAGSKDIASAKPAPASAAVAAAPAPASAGAPPATPAAAKPEEPSRVEGPGPSKPRDPVWESKVPAVTGPKRLPELVGTRPIPVALPRVEAGDTPLVPETDRWYGSLTPLFATFLPETETRRVETKRELQNAGFFQPHAYENLQASRYLGSFFGLLLGALFLVAAPPRLELYSVGALVCLPLLGWATPRLYVKGKAKDRRTEIEKAMPDMLDMLNMCVSQGMTVPASMKRVADELPHVHPALHKELLIITDQARVGSMEAALENFRRRVDVPEVHSFCNLMLQTERMGTSVSFALQEYSDNMRTALQQRADEKGNRAAFKLLFPTVLCLMPAVYMILLGPAVVSFQRYSAIRAGNEGAAQAREIINNQTRGRPNR